MTTPRHGRGHSPKATVVANHGAKSFEVHKLETFSENPGKVNFEVLVHLLMYIRYNKTLGLKYSANINDAPVSDLLIKANIKTENHLLAFSDSSCRDCPDTGISIGAYLILYQVGPIDHGTHVTGLVDLSSAKSEYNESCTEGIALAHFRMLIHESLNKDPYIFPEESPLFVLDGKSAACMDKNGKDNKHTRHITRRIHFVSNG